MINYVWVDTRVKKFKIPVARPFLRSNASSWFLRVVPTCETCGKNGRRLVENMKNLPLFPVKTSFDSFWINALGPWTIRNRGSAFLLVTMDRFTKLVWKISIKGVSTTKWHSTSFMNRSFSMGNNYNASPITVNVSLKEALRWCLTHFKCVEDFATIYLPRRKMSGKLEWYYNRSAGTFLPATIYTICIYVHAYSGRWKFQCHLAMAVAPFEVILSSSPGPLAG